MRMPVCSLPMCLNLTVPDKSGVAVHRFLPLLLFLGENGMEQSVRLQWLSGNGAFRLAC